MSSLKIELYDDLEAFDDFGHQIFLVRRTSSWTSKISLSFYLKNKLVLRTHYHTLFPFSKVRIDFQDLEHKISIGKREVHVEGLGLISIEQTHFVSVFSKYLGKLFFNGAEIAEVRMKDRTSTSTLILNVNFNTDSEEIIFYAIMLLAIENCDIDGE